MSTCDRPSGGRAAAPPPAAIQPPGGPAAAAQHTGPPGSPLVRVVRGVPTPDELAALVGVLIGRRRPTAPDHVPLVSHWARSGNPAHLRTLPGPDGWRRSGLPA